MVAHSLTPTFNQQPVENVERKRERERHIYIYIYTRLHASWCTRELMPLTHRSHLPGLSYGDIFDRAIIPNTIYTARARRDAHVIRSRP